MGKRKDARKALKKAYGKLQRALDELNRVNSDGTAGLSQNDQLLFTELKHSMYCISTAQANVSTMLDIIEIGKPEPQPEEETKLSLTHDEA
jgi:hypothetical protein